MKLSDQALAWARAQHAMYQAAVASEEARRGDRQKTRFQQCSEWEIEICAAAIAAHEAA